MASNVPSFPSINITDLNDPAIRTWWDLVTKFLNTSSISDDTFGGTGLLARTGTGTYAARTLQTSNGLSVTNGNAILGNPDFSLAINTLSEETGVQSSDYLLLYDVSSSSHKKALVTNVINSPTPGSSTYNFSAEVSGNVTNATGDGTAYTILFDSIEKNSGLAYNAGTGIFTAPITGLYGLNAIVSLQNLGAGHATDSASFVINSTAHIFSRNIMTSVDASGLPIISGAGSFMMTVGDTAKIVVTVSGSTKTITVSAGCRFSGFLIGE